MEAVLSLKTSSRSQADLRTSPDDNHSTGGMIRAKCVLRKWLVGLVGRFGW